MMRSVLLLITGMFLLVGCGSTVTGPGGETLGSGINNANQGQAQTRMLDGVNALRRAQGLQEIRLDSSLNAAAESHSRDMARQQRPWHFSSDGSSPLERVQRAGYQRTLLGENISESFETELQTLTAWMQSQDTREAILDQQAADMGFAFFKEDSGKFWYTLLIGGGGAAMPVTPTPPARTTEAPVIETPPVDLPEEPVS